MLLQGAISGIFMAITVMLYVQIRDWFALQQALNASLVNPVVAKKEDTFQHKRNSYDKDIYKQARKAQYLKFSKEHVEKSYIKTKKRKENKEFTVLQQLDYLALGEALKAGKR